MARRYSARSTFQPGARAGPVVARDAGAEQHQVALGVAQELLAERHRDVVAVDGNRAACRVAVGQGLGVELERRLAQQRAGAQRIALGIDSAFILPICTLLMERNFQFHCRWHKLICLYVSLFQYLRFFLC